MNRLILAMLLLLAVFTVSAVGAAEDVSVDNMTVEDVDDSVCELPADEIDVENDEDVLESGDAEVLSEKQDSGMEVSFVDEFKEEVKYKEFLIDDLVEYYFAVKFPSKVSGKLSLYIDDKFMAEKKITATTHYISLNSESYNLTLGKHTAKITYSGDDNYSPATWVGNFELIPYSIMIDSDVNYGSTELLIVDIYEATGDIIATIEGKRYTVPLIRGIAIVELPALGIGDHKVHVDYAGDKDHVSRSVDGTFTVSASICGPESEYIPFSESAEISLQLPSNAKGNLVVTLNDKEIGNVKLVNGFARVALPKFKDLNERYEVYAEYTGSDYAVWGLNNDYYSDPLVKVESDMIRGKEYTFYFEVPSKYSGNLEVDVPGYSESFETKVVNGKASVKFIAQESGYINWSFEDISSGDVYVTVGLNPNMAVSVDSKAGQNPVFKVNVANNAGGAIIVSINGKEYTSSYFTKSGSLTIPGLKDGTYKATVTYSGDFEYCSVTKEVTFTKTSKKAADKISLTLKKVKVKKSAKKLVLKATLKINGKAAKGKAIKFKFNKKNFKAKTNKKGVAKVTVKKKFLKKLKVGKKVKIQARYGKNIKKLSVKVKK